MKKFLLTFIGILAFVISMNARTYTHQFASTNKESLQSGGAIELSGFVWNSSGANSIGWNTSGKGIQFGSTSAVCSSFTLSTSAFSECKIKKVTVTSSMASACDAKLTIQAGGTTSEAYALTTSNADYTLDLGSAIEKGDITISWTASKKRAYYVKSIAIVYVPDKIDAENPTFTTPTDSIYQNTGKDFRVIAGTKDQSFVVYYTMDGTDPSYEDYNSDPRVGTTESSRTYQIDPKLIDSLTVNTIRAMAVLVDEDVVFKSDVVEATYIYSPTKPYVSATAITNEKRYAFFASNDSVADALVPGKANGYLKGRNTVRKNNAIETVEYDGFTFKTTNGGYTIQDAVGRYMYINGASNEFYFANEQPATGAVWSVAFKDGKTEIKNGSYTVYYVAAEDKFGCYEAAGEGMELPSLYLLCEYPQITITPGMNSEVKGLQEVIISCEEGISASDDLVLRAVGLPGKDNTYEIEKIYSCTQVDKNTLKFTLDTLLSTENNIEIKLDIKSGDIFLNPEGMKYPIPRIDRYSNNICKYSHKGDAAADKLQSVTPANGSIVEELSHFVFAFTKEATTHSEDAALQPRLYAEGYPMYYNLDWTKENSEGKMIKTTEAALKTEEPVLGNGVHILEIPTGYFIDRNGNPIEGITLRYTIRNNSGIQAGIEDIAADGSNKWTVYNITGAKVLETTNADDLKNLAKGIYIINGKKRLIK